MHSMVTSSISLLHYNFVLQLNKKCLLSVLYSSVCKHVPGGGVGEERKRKKCARYPQFGNFQNKHIPVIAIIKRS